MALLSQQPSLGDSAPPEQQTIRTTSARMRREVTRRRRRSGLERSRAGRLLRCAGYRAGSCQCGLLRSTATFHFPPSCRRRSQRQPVTRRTATPQGPRRASRRPWRSSQVEGEGEEPRRAGRAGIEPRTGHQKKGLRLPRKRGGRGRLWPSDVFDAPEHCACNGTTAAVGAPTAE